MNANDTSAAIQNALSSRPVTVAALSVALGVLTTAIFQPLGGDLAGALPSPTVVTVGGLKPWREFVAGLTVTATNTLSPLPQPYDGRLCRLFVNGVVATDRDANAPFAVSGTTVTWSQANAGYALQTSFVVTADCTY